MFHDKEIPRVLSSWMTSYASFAGSVMVAQAMANQVLNILLPNQVKYYLLSHLHRLFRFPSNIFTIVIDESSGIARNEVYDACEAYLCNKICQNTQRLNISKTPKDRKMAFKLVSGESIVDRFDGIEITWSFACSSAESASGIFNVNYKPRTSSSEKRWYEVRFHKKHKDKILGSYMLSILEKANALNQEGRILKMHTLNNSPSYGMIINWESINFEHPATFHTLAMEPDLKKSIMEDLDRFVKQKEFYKRVGRAWKRGYLLYGPPGTGKSSLVAAMANHLKFNVYDLQLASIMRDSDLRRLLLAIGNRSILVIEDIDCSVDLPDRIRPVRSVDGSDGRRQPRQDAKLTLSGLLNFIDGLWSSCGDERIIVFTTNHKERLDPALLRPGRMDMHIHMSYCTSNGFRMLASNYLGINSSTTTHDKLFGEIEGLIENAKVTPAQVAEELMKSDDSDIALEELVKLLKRKRLEGGDAATDHKVDDEIQEAKRQKLEGKY